MGEIGDRCYTCRWYICLAAKYHCLLARNIIEEPLIAEYCDFYREDQYEDIHDNLSKKNRSE